MSRSAAASSFPAPPPSRVLPVSSDQFTVKSSDIPHYTIDLSLPPAQRWNQIIRDYSPYWPGMAEQMWKEFEELHGEHFPEADEDDNGGKKKKKGKKKKLTAAEKAAIAAAKHAEHVKFAEGLTEQLFTAFRAQGLSAYAEELESVSKQSGISLPELVLLNLSYEAHGGCTTILAPYYDPVKKTQTVIMGRTLDWQQPLLRQLTVELSFVRQGQLIYRATSFAGFLGIFTGHKPRAYALAVNYRCSDEVAFNEEAEGDADGGDEDEGDEADEEMEDGEEGSGDESGVVHPSTEEERESDFSWPVGFLVRHILETCSGYDEAVQRLHTSDLMSQVYFIACGTQPNQGCLITRDPQHTVKPVTLPTQTIAAAEQPQQHKQEEEEQEEEEEEEEKKRKKRPYTKHGAFQSDNIAAATAASSSSSSVAAPVAVPTPSSSLVAPISIPAAQSLDSPWLVQANMDHWLKLRQMDHQESLPRTRLVNKEFQAHLAKASAAPTTAVNEDFVWQVMGKAPIWDEETIYATVSVPSTDRYVTLIENPFPQKSIKKGVQLKKRRK